MADTDHIDELLSKVEDDLEQAPEWPFDLAIILTAFILGMCIGAGLVALGAALAGVLL